MKTLLKLLTVLLFTVLTFCGCEPLEHAFGVENPEQYSKVYMPLSINGTMSYNLAIDEAEKADVEIYANIGGLVRTECDLAVTFRIEKDSLDVYNTRNNTTYSLLPDGKVQVINKGIRSDGSVSIIKVIAAACPPAGSGELKVSFFRPFYGAYRIIYLSPEYDLALVTSSTRDYLWLLSRQKKISSEQKSFCMNWLREHDFPSDRLIWVSQTDSF